MAMRGRRRRACKFCEDRKLTIDYKNIRLLRKFLTEQGRIMSHRNTGNCAHHQRELARAIKRARNISLVAFLGEESVE